ncbi:MAG: alpha/beta hydrolase [Hyphomonadaceae bacterium]|nr:alpha/beta hydrolase [Hyphomonadaceae bacterium]
MDAGAPVLGGFSESFVDTVDGLKLYTRDYEPLLPQTGAPVICLHGLTRNSRDFETVAPRIAALGRRVIAPDMRGRGRSDYDQDPAHYVPTVYAQDVLTLLDKLEISEAVFLGTSMGGIITMVVSALAPNRVAAAVLNDIGPRLKTEGLTRIASYVGRTPPIDAWEQAVAAVRGLAEPVYPARADDAAFWDTFTRRLFRQREDGKFVPDYDANIALAFSDPETATPVDMTPLFKALAAKPVLSVRGALSDLFGPDIVVYMQSLKTDMEAVEVPDVGHAPILDEPAAWDPILDFLARVK